MRFNALAIAAIAIGVIIKTQISSLFNGDHFHYRCALKRFEARWSAIAIADYRSPRNATRSRNGNRPLQTDRPAEILQPTAINGRRGLISESWSSDRQHWNSTINLGFTTTESSNKASASNRDRESVNTNRKWQYSHKSRKQHGNFNDKFVALMYNVGLTISSINNTA